MSFRGLSTKLIVLPSLYSIDLPPAWVSSQPSLTLPSTEAPLTKDASDILVLISVFRIHLPWLLSNICQPYPLVFFLERFSSSLWHHILLVFLPFLWLLLLFIFLCHSFSFTWPLTDGVPQSLVLNSLFAWHLKATSNTYWMLNISLAVLDDKIFENNMIKCMSSWSLYFSRTFLF